jgi:hypothetical protein
MKFHRKTFDILKLKFFVQSLTNKFHKQQTYKDMQTVLIQK